ncbi:hypothetical protein R3P38DRAFT_3213659 [Favolaschia claudopus]|uniref:Uncharacterized protein n=1 Tax=Favolaschia claudopus TaxID=2862362 RepID=A0AAW0ACE5_9AGAR
MPDLLHYTLVVCLVLSNLNRIIWAVKTIYEYLTRPRAPQLVPYFHENGNLIGMVRVPVDALERLRGNDRSPATEIPAIDNSNAPASAATTPDDATAAAAAHRNSKSDLAAPSHSPEVIPETRFTWDCWPDGPGNKLGYGNNPYQGKQPCKELAERTGNAAALLGCDQVPRK